MPAPLRVAVVARAVMPLHGYGGLERSVRDLTRHLAARGVEVTLIVPPPDRASRSGSAALASPHITVRHVSYVTFPFANRRGTTILDRSTAYLAYGWRAGRAAHRLAREGRIDVIHGFGASVLGAAIAPPIVPLVLNPQGLEEFGATGAGPRTLKRLGYAPLRWAVRRVARAADCIIATDVALEATVARHLRPRPGQMVTIPNGIDLVETTGLAGPADGAAIRQRSGIAADDTVLLSVGRLEFNKGFDVLAAALGRAAAPGGALSGKAWRWVLAGAGPYRAEIEAAVGSRAIGPHVLFAGRLEDAALHAWYEAATIFVHPTRYEGSSLVTLEAMAHRLPVIATVAGGLPDKVRPGLNGWLVPPGSADDLARAIGDALSHRDRLRDMGQASWDIVSREFAWPILAARQVDVYEALLRRRAET